MGTHEHLFPPEAIEALEETRRAEDLKKHVHLVGRALMTLATSPLADDPRTVPLLYRYLTLSHHEVLHTHALEALAYAARHTSPHPPEALDRFAKLARRTSLGPHDRLLFAACAGASSYRRIPPILETHEPSPTSSSTPPRSSSRPTNPAHQNATTRSWR